ncbi:unnamed protein product, partial [Candidula unifasciata]
GELHTACQNGTLDDVIKCLQASKGNTQWYYEGQSPIHTAILSGRADACEVIQVLQDYGADINAQTRPGGDTALHLAVLRDVYPRKFDLIKYLLKRKADMTIRNKLCIIDSVLANQADRLKKYIELGGDPNTVNKEEDTALNLAIKNPRLRDNGQLIECVRLLVDAGADCNIQDWDGKNALELAVEKGYKDIVKILRNK